MIKKDKLITKKKTIGEHFFNIKTRWFNPLSDKESQYNHIMQRNWMNVVKNMQQKHVFLLVRHKNLDKVRFCSVISLCNDNRKFWEKLRSGLGTLTRWHSRGITPYAVTIKSFEKQWNKNFWREYETKLKSYIKIQLSIYLIKSSKLSNKNHF